MKNNLVLFCFLLTTLVCFGQTVKKKSDFYTEIAKFKQNKMDRSMERIVERSLSTNKILPWSKHEKGALTSSLSKLSTKQSVKKALTELKEDYTPFLKDLAPSLSPVASAVKIKEMQFRYETKEDQQSFQRLLNGSGHWETITIPYYHGPQGPSTAWYRTSFKLSEQQLSFSSLMLHFNGADYYCDAYINGHHVGYHEGMLDEFEFDIKPFVHKGENQLLVRLRNDYSMLGSEGHPRFWGNKLAASNSPGWDDPKTGWTCCPSGYGLYQDVSIYPKGSPAIASVFCRPLLPRKEVEIWVELDLSKGNKANSFLLQYSLFGQNFKATVVRDQLKKVAVVGGRVLYKFKEKIPEEKFRYWSPDAPWLYQLQVTLLTKDKVVLDNCKQQFGLRDFMIAQQSKPKGRFYLNGKEIRLRGTNTMGFLQKDVMAHDWEQLVEDLLLVKLTNMNFIRTTQRIVQKEVYEYADRLGVMMQADLPLFAYINQKQYPEILKQAVGIERVLRNHPSVILLSYLNESMGGVKPHAISRTAYEQLFEALDVVVHNENPDRAIKYVGGDYQAPNKGYPDNHCYNIWYDNHGISIEKMCRGAWMNIHKGWMYGCGEFGAEGLDPVDLMRKRYPKNWLAKQPDGSWNPSVLRGQFSGSQTYGHHFSWYETEYTMKDWVAASHQHQCWGVSTVARAFRRMPRMNSFAIHLFIDAWPNGWMKAIVDSERTPKPAWYAYRDILSPIAVQIESERSAFYSSENSSFELWICNDTQKQPDCELRYQLEKGNKVIQVGKVDAQMPSVSEGSLFQGFLPLKMPTVKKETAYLIRVSLCDKKNNKVLHQDVKQIKVYPSLAKSKKQRVYCIGESSEVNYLTRIIGTDNKIDKGHFLPDDVIFIASFLSDSQLAQVTSAVEKGAQAVVLKSALKSVQLQRQLGYKVTQQGSNWIVFRNRKHPWVKGTTKRDLFYPYSSLLQRPKRYNYIGFLSSSITPVLTCKKNLVLGEKKQGKGCWSICGLDLNGYLDVNPAFTKIVQHIYERKK